MVQVFSVMLCGDICHLLDMSVRLSICIDHGIPNIKKGRKTLRESFRYGGSSLSCF